jgi:hypothetical protein
MNNLQNNQKSDATPMGYDTLLATVAKEFVDWRDKLHSETRGGKLMFDAPKHYKWLDESELFTYYMDIGRYCT